MTDEVETCVFLWEMLATSCGPVAGSHITLPFLTASVPVVGRQPHAQRPSCPSTSHFSVCVCNNAQKTIIKLILLMANNNNFSDFCLETMSVILCMCI